MFELEENELEIALRLAVDEPAYRPDFYKKLLDSIIFVFGKANEDAEQERVIQQGEKIAILNWQKQDGSPVIPFFTSLNILKKNIHNEVNYIALPARSLFEMTLGTNLVLNPNHPYTKEFISSEIQALLDSAVDKITIARTIEEETRVFIGPPEVYPAKLVDSLSILFSKRKQVKAAYLAVIHETSHDENPHLVIGMEIESDIEQIMSEAGSVAGDTAPNNEPVDLFRVIVGEEGISDYFLQEVEPFYERRWGSKLSPFLGLSGNA